MIFWTFSDQLLQDTVGEDGFSPTRLAFEVLTFPKGIGWCGTSGRFPQQGRPVPPAPAARFPQNSILATQKQLGACLGGHESPCGNGDTQIPTYVGIGAISMCSPSQNNILAAEKTLGRVSGGIKSPCGNGDMHFLGFPNKNTVFSYVKTLGRVLGGHKKPLREWGHAKTEFLGI